MNQLFEVKVSYERQADELGIRKVSEVYLINALSFTEAEARATKEIQPYAFGGELTIDSCRKRRIAEIIESADTQDDRWFEARVSFITLDEKSGTDGLLHIVICALIAAVLTTLLHPLIAAVATIVIGVAKEFVYDLVLHRKAVSVKDIVCDIIGTVIVLISQI